MSHETKPSNELKTAGPAVPIFFFILTALLLLGGAIYVDLHGGGFNSKVYAPYSDFDYLSKLGERSDDPTAKGKFVYENKGCAACHQNHGGGSAAQGFPPLAGSEWVTAPGPNRLIRVVLHGLTGPITVKGEKYGIATMTPFHDVLTDEEIAAVLSYIRSNKVWGNDASLVTVGQVKTVREAVKSRATPWTGPELESVPEK